MRNHFIICVLIVYCIFGWDPSVHANEAMPLSQTKRLDLALSEQKNLQALGILLAMQEQRLGQDELLEIQLQSARLWIELGDYETAIRTLEPIVKQVPDTQTFPAFLEWMKAHYLLGNGRTMSRAWSLFRKIERDRNQKSFLAPMAALDEWFYIGGLLADRLGRDGNAQNLWSNIESSSEWFPYAQHALGNLYRTDNKGSRAIRSWRNSIAWGAKHNENLSPIDQDAIYRTRLSLAKLLIENKQFDQAQKILADIPPDSRFYQESLISRAWAIAQGASENALLESMVYLKRSIEQADDPLIYLQTRLLMGRYYSRLNVPQKSTDVLRSGLTEIESIRRSQAAIMRNPDLYARYRQTKSLPKSKSTSLDHLAFLMTPSAQKAWQIFDRMSDLEVMLQQNITDMKNLNRLLEYEGFDPFFLQTDVDGKFHDLVSASILNDPLISRNVREAYFQIVTRISIFELAKIYSYLLVEERKWNNITQLLLKGALAEKISNQEKMEKDRELIRNYYLADELFEKNQAVQDLEGKIKQAEADLFLEKRLKNQFESAQKVLEHQDKRLKKLWERYRTQLSLSERDQVRYLDKKLEIYRQENDLLQKVIQYDLASKRWQKNYDQIALYLENPLAEQMKKEVEQIRLFIAKIEREDEEARQRLFQKIKNMENTLYDSYGRLVRYILSVVVRQHIAKCESGLIRLRQARAQANQVLGQSLVRDVQQQDRRLARYQSSIRLELAKVMDDQGGVP